MAVEGENKILIVDDDTEDQEFLKEALTEIISNVEFVTAKNGYEALGILNESRLLPHYIFMDINMPKMNGIECLQEIKANPFWKNIPVILWTTSSSEQQKRRIVEMGGFHFLTKPVNLPLLAKELRLILNS